MNPFFIIYHLRKMNTKKIIALITIFIITVLPLSQVQRDCFSAYRVVIDPGHGGVFSKDKKKHGDRYDRLSGNYLSYFAEGANYRRLYERELTYSIAKRVEKLLSYCSENGDFSKFKKILDKYSSGEHKKIIIETKLSRGPSVGFKEAKSMNDPNAPFRLYDYPDGKGAMIKGRISKINEFKPHIVVSIHNAETAPPDYKGMNAVIAPPYKIMEDGLNNMKKGKFISPVSYGRLECWFQGRKGVSKKRAFYEDVALYFTGFGLKKNYSSDSGNFKGYRYNMVSWKYADKGKWYEKAMEHKSGSQYADYKTCKISGKYWERERSKYEEFRRGSSFQNFGGDNLYASNEIIKYILTSLAKKGYKKSDKVAGKPFVSVWSVPLLVNAISAYIEIGYFNRKWDKQVLAKKHDEVAEGIAVGIYSLLAGLKDVKSSKIIRPSGKAIDFEKYKIDNEKTYFDMVVE